MYKLIFKITDEFKRIVSTGVERLLLPLCGVKLGKKLICGGLMFVENMGSIAIGDDAIINSASWANPIGAGSKCYLKTFPTGKITIGNHCGMSNCAIVSETEVCIGNWVRIGSGVKIYDTDFHPIQIRFRVGKEKDDSKTVSKPVVIEDGVFIGAESIILKGSTIGKNAVIGAGSVISGNVPPSEIWAGNPARFIKKIPEWIPE